MSDLVRLVVIGYRVQGVLYMWLQTITEPPALQPFIPKCWNLSSESHRLPFLFSVLYVFGVFFSWTQPNSLQPFLYLLYLIWRKTSCRKNYQLYRYVLLFDTREFNVDPCIQVVFLLQSSAVLLVARSERDIPVRRDPWSKVQSELQAPYLNCCNIEGLILLSIVSPL